METDWQTSTARKGFWEKGTACAKIRKTRLKAGGREGGREKKKTRLFRGR